MTNLIESFNQRDTAIAAGVGCATGFLWSAIAGRADLSTGKGWARASYGCAGSAINGAGIYGFSRYATQDPDFSRQLTMAWFGVQSAASFTNFLGTENGWQEEPAFNAIAFPLNYAATPIVSSVGLIVGGVGEMGVGFTGKLELFGGSLVFHHKLCDGRMFQTAAISHYCDGGKSPLTQKFHEVGHTIHETIQGDLGYSLLYGLNWAAIRPFSSEDMHKFVLAEGWAQHFGETSLHLFRRSNAAAEKGIEFWERQIARLEKDLGDSGPQPRIYLRYLWTLAEYYQKPANLNEREIGKFAEEEVLSKEEIRQDLLYLKELPTSEGRNKNETPSGPSFSARNYLWEYFQTLQKLAGNLTNLGYFKKRIDALQRLGREAEFTEERLKQDRIHLAGLAYRLCIKTWERNLQDGDHHEDFSQYDKFFATRRDYAKLAGLGEAQLKKDEARLRRVHYESINEELRKKIREEDPRKNYQSFLERIQRLGTEAKISHAKIKQDQLRLAEGAYQRVQEEIRLSITMGEESFADLEILLKKYGKDAGWSEAKIEEDLLRQRDFQDFVQDKDAQTIGKDRFKKTPSKEELYLRAHAQAARAILEGKDYEEKIREMENAGNRTDRNSSQIGHDKSLLYRKGYFHHLASARELKAANKDFKFHLELIRVFGQKADLNNSDIEKALKEFETSEEKK